MLDVNTVIEGDFEPSTMFEALEASVLVDDLQARVNTGKSNVFGYVMVRARIIHGQFKAMAEGWNQSKPWYEVAATVFNDEAVQALAAGEVKGYDSNRTKTFQNAVRTLKKAMELDAPLDEKDDVSGAFVLGSKAQVEQWNKKEVQRIEEEQAAEAREISIAAAKAQGIELVPPAKESTDSPAETGTVFDRLPQDLQEPVMEYLENLLTVYEDNPKEALVMINRGVTATARHIATSLKHVKEAATG